MSLRNSISTSRSYSSSTSTSNSTSFSSSSTTKKNKENEEDLTWIFPSQFIDYYGVGALNLEDFEGDEEKFESTKQTIIRRNRLHRTKSLLYLHHLSKALKVEAKVMWTASVFFQRFYLFHSYDIYDRFLMVLTSIFLAAKSEEFGLRIEDLIHKHLEFLPNKRDLTKPKEAVYIELKNSILKMEHILLSTLGFDLVVVHPDVFYATICRRLVPNYLSMLEIQLLSHVIRLFLTESYRSSVCLQYTPYEWSCILIFLSIKSICLNASMTSSIISSMPSYPSSSNSINLERFENITISILGEGYIEDEEMILNGCLEVLSVCDEKIILNKNELNSLFNELINNLKNKKMVSSSLSVSTAISSSLSNPSTSLSSSSSSTTLPLTSSSSSFDQDQMDEDREEDEDDEELESEEEDSDEEVTFSSYFPKKKMEKKVKVTKFSNFSSMKNEKSDNSVENFSETSNETFSTSFHHHSYIESEKSEECEIERDNNKESEREDESSDEESVVNFQLVHKNKKSSLSSSSSTLLSSRNLPPSFSPYEDSQLHYHDDSQEETPFHQYCNLPSPSPSSSFPSRTPTETPTFQNRRFYKDRSGSFSEYFMYEGKKARMEPELA